MSKSDGIKIGAVVAFIVAGLFFSLHRGVVYPVAIGEYAPDFSLPRLINGSLSPDPLHLYEERGHVVLVNFWATWCPPCVEETPSLEKFSTDMEKYGVEVIGVSVDQNAGALRKFIAQNHVTYPVARDPEQTTAGMYGTTQFPETYILDRDGRVAEKIIGARDWEDPMMLKFVRSLVPGAGGR